MQDILKATGETDELLAAWVIGYDTDGGGYGFTRARGKLGKLGAILYDGHVDYMGLSDALPRGFGGIIAIVPSELGNGNLADFPTAIRTGHGRMRRIARGLLYATDHECGWCGPGTGEENEASRPTCIRCGGDGHVESPGGSWAAYDHAD